MKTRIRVHVYEIDWDTEGEEKVPRLPKQFELDLDIADVECEIQAGGDVNETIVGQIESYMDDKYGFCHNGFKWCFN